LPEAQKLAAANKRIGNILRKSADGQTIAATIEAAHLQEPAEHALVKAMNAVEPGVQAQFKQQAFKAAYLQLAALRTPVDAFFESVMVMAEDPAVRANRLAILSRLHRLMNQGADLSKLAV
jgi:glycyl-tRNA synthetase beta chain